MTNFKEKGLVHLKGCVKVTHNWGLQIESLKKSHVGGVWLSETGHFIGCFPEYL